MQLATKKEKYTDTERTPAERARALLEEMTLDEKMAQHGCIFPFGDSYDDMEQQALEMPYGIGQVSTLEMRRIGTLEEAAGWQRKMQETVMRQSPHHIPAIFHMEGLCGAFIQEGTSFPSGIARGSGWDPELEEKKEFIFNVIAKEEANFNKTIDQGLAILADMEAEMEKNGEKVLSGENAFKLYDTYGFPIDLTSEILEEKGLTYDEEGFKKAQEEQRAKSEGTFGTHSYTGKEVSVYDQLDAALETEFVGYDNLTFDSKVTALTTETEVVDALSDGEKGTIIVEQTPFYATMGGQEADKGVIRTADGEFVVEDCIHLAGTKVGHVGHVVKGMIKIVDAVTLEVDAKNRALTERNHSATHLLQKALRTVLGSHVEQAGSFVNADRLRFDFTHFSAVTPEELKKVEEIVNEQITNALAVVTKNLPIEEARKTGAQALFGEKYGDVVRVVDMSGFSVEFCGGTHVKNTSEITALKIISESGVAAGVRRIEALTSEGLMNYYAEMERLLKEAAQLVKATPENLAEKITHLQAENKSLKGEVESLKSKMAQSAAGDILDQVKEVKGVKLLAAQLDGVDMNGLRDLGDQLKEKLGEGVVVLASGDDGKVSLMATATDGAMKQGAHAGNLVKAIAGLVPDEELNENNILPEAFDPRVADVVSRAVKELI